MPFPGPAPARVHQGLTRRALLAGGVAGTVLAACGTGTQDTTGSGTATSAPATPPAASDVTAAALRAAGFGEAAVVLGPQVTWSELVVGQPRHLQFVVTNGTDGSLVTDPVQLALVTDGTVVAGPLASTFIRDDRIPSGGLHVVQVEVEEPNVLDVVVATADGALAGTTAMQAIVGADSVAPAPGEVLGVVGTRTARTPTVDAPGNLAELCTADPDCPLHDRTLAQALDAGPTVLCIATPKFCSTAICGPVLDDVVAVATSGAHPQVQFVHVEPFVDAGQTITRLMADLELPSEPWTFVLAQDGTILHRFPGPVPSRVLDEALRTATA